MAQNLNEISAIIKKQIEHYHEKVTQDDIGKVVSVGDGIVKIYGLEKAMLGELLSFKDDIYGLVMNLNEDSIGGVLFAGDKEIEEGDIVKRTRRVIEVPVGDALLGRVVNALGQPLDGLGEIKTDKHRPIERIAPGVMTRKSVSRPLETGIEAIDSMIPIGRGQRELIIGDRQTGKTSIAVDTIINQKGKNCLCIYVAIGQKTSSVKKVYQKLKDHDALAYTVIVAATASELDPLKYIAPYAGCAMGEEWMEEGKDVLIVYDDLSKHAIAYRTLSLLLKRAPGREAYPGDVFYLHSRLLERACNLDAKHGGGSLTALPIIETQAGDISSYIPTNVISITDGQIFLVSDLFNSGFRPAIDTGFSVSRVGSSAQYKCMKQASKSLKIELANFREVQSFAQFGTDLDAQTKKTISHGKALMEMLKQNQYAPKSYQQMVIELLVAQHGYLDDLPLEEIRKFLDDLYTSISSLHKEFIDQLTEKKAIDDKFIHDLMEVVTTFKRDYHYER